MAVAAIVVGGLTAYSSYRSSKRQERILKANAADLRELASFNADSYIAAGDVNAQAVLNVGEANAVLIERETERAMQMYAIEAAEGRRRHVLGQKMTAGSIRTMVGAAGVQTNTGTPLHYLHAQVKLGIQERRYGDIKTYWSLVNMYESGEDKADVTRYTAEQQAQVIRTNAAIQAEMSLADAEYRAKAMERGADAAGSGALLNAVTAGFQAYVGAGGSFGFTTPPSTNYSLTSSGWNNSYGFGLGGAPSQDWATDGFNNYQIGL